MYTSASIARHAGGAPPTFAAATDLNQPIWIEVYNISDSGENVFSYSDARPETSFSVKMARHTENQSSIGADTFAVDFPPPGVSECSLLAWSSLTSTNVPLWTFNQSNCTAYGFDVSDDGSSIAFSAALDIGLAKPAPVLWFLNAQTGQVRWTIGGNDDTQPGGTPMVSSQGSYVAYTKGDDTVQVLSGLDGSPRGEAISMGWNTIAQLSDSGEYLAYSGQDAASIYQWSESAGAYQLAHSLVPSGPSSTWYSITTAVSSDGSGSDEGELACFGFIGNGALTARILIVSMTDGTVLSDYTTPQNVQLQTNPNVKMDGNYCGIALWGDNDDVPTAVVLQAGNSVPIFTYVTPGSMFGVDLVVDVGGDLYVSVAGKHVPANSYGNGGDAYTWRISA